jgi:hypothetical protein
MVPPTNSQAKEDESPWVRIAYPVPDGIVVIISYSLRSSAVRPSIEKLSTMKLSIVKPSIKRFEKRLVKFYGRFGSTRTLCEYKNVELVKGSISLDYVHMYVKIPPKPSVSG